MYAPRKRFGQHFLHDTAVLSRIINTLQPKPDEHLVEIGPGRGALTLLVLAKTKALDAIELDRDLIPYLKTTSAPLGNLIIHEADVLHFDFNILAAKKPLRIFGNLPYNISTPLIFHLLTYAHLTHDMLFMLQKEVAERIAANVGDNAYGRLSIMVQYYCDVNLLFDVSKNAFSPPPKVESSIIQLIPKKNITPNAKDPKIFSDIVRAAFNQRRKTLRNSLKNIASLSDFKIANIKETLRAENLSVNDFVNLANIIADKKFS